MRDNPEAAAAMGVDVARTKVIAFTLTSALAGIAGMVYAFVDNTVNPPIFGIDNAFLLLFMVIVGGAGRACRRGDRRGAAFPAAVLALAARRAPPRAGLRRAGGGRDPAPARGIDRSMGSILDLKSRSLTKRFGGLTAVAGLDFDVREGEILGVIGPNGAGKSTTFNIIAGAYAADERARSASPASRSSACRRTRSRARGVMRTFQHNRPFAGMSVLDNVLVGAHTRFQQPISLREKLLGRGAKPARVARERADRVRRPGRVCATPTWRRCPSARAACSRSRARWPGEPRAHPVRRAGGRAHAGRTRCASRESSAASPRAASRCC